MATPSLIMVAGPNGSGKTTLIHTLRASREIALPALYINADDLQRERRLDARAAQKLAEKLRLEALMQGRSFMYETVMSHPSKIAELQAAAMAGYTITVIYVATDDPAVNIERIALRVAVGGHDVPRDRIRARHRRSLSLAPSALALAAHAYVYDNTAWGEEAPQQLQAALADGRLQPLVEKPAAWVRELIGKVNARSDELEDFYRSTQDRAEFTVANLYESASDGPIAVKGKYYALQIDRASGRTLIHDKALLSKPVTHRHSYRIEYVQGVSKVSRSGTAKRHLVQKK